MKISQILFITVLLLSFSSACYALDWQRLHDYADKKDIVAIESSVKNNPDSVDDLYVLALTYLDKHKDSEAGEIFKRILSLSPDTYEAKWGEAEVLRRGHKLKESEQILRQLVKEHPEFAPAFITLAYISYINMDFEAAVRFGKKVLSLGRSRVDLSNLTLAYMIIGGAKGMLAHYGGPISKPINGLAVAGYLKEGEKLNPDKAAVLYGIGSYYLLAPPIAGRDIRKAEEYYKKTIKVDPLFSDAYVRLAQLCQMRGEQACYEQNISKALSIDPGNEIALDIKSGTCKFVCPAISDK